MKKYRKHVINSVSPFLIVSADTLSKQSLFFNKILHSNSFLKNDLLLSKSFLKRFGNANR